MKYKGRWQIYEMEMWDADYFNEEVQAYISIGKDGSGEFHFGYVYCELDGKVVNYPGGERFEFSFDGNDENDPVNGCGWLNLKDSETLEGEFRFHMGDDSTFLAKRAAK